MIKTNDMNQLGLLLYMDLIATLVKKGHALAMPYVYANAIQIMPDGVAIFDQDKFYEVMKATITRL